MRQDALRERLVFGVAARLTIAVLAGVGALVLADNLFVQQRTPKEQIARIARLTDAAPPAGAVPTDAVASTNTVASAESVVSIGAASSSRVVPAANESPAAMPVPSAKAHKPAGVPKKVAVRGPHAPPARPVTSEALLLAFKPFRPRRSRSGRSEQRSKRDEYQQSLAELNSASAAFIAQAFALDGTPLGNMASGLKGYEQDADGLVLMADSHRASLGEYSALLDRLSAG